MDRRHPFLPGWPHACYNQPMYKNIVISILAAFIGGTVIRIVLRNIVLAMMEAGNAFALDFGMVTVGIVFIAEIAIYVLTYRSLEQRRKGKEE